MKRLVWLSVVLALFSAAAAAQATPVKIIDFKVDVPLDKFPPGGPVSTNQVVCPGGYFLLEKRHSDGKESGEGLAYVIKVKSPPAAEAFSAHFLFLKRKFQLFIDPAKHVPTARLIGDGDSVEKIVLRMDNEAYQQAKTCLPTPSN